ncbi:MAG: beta-ketoacyl-ACP synthase II [Clostridiales bacterium]|nr:beta-ketoacyl-ACP synthase II [Clostridiales bacterium]
MRKVVVTGIGVISPVGNDIDTFWNNLIFARSGIDTITKFDTTNFKAKLAAEVKDFDPNLYYSDKSEIRRSDLFSQYAMGAATQAIQDSGLDNFDYNPHRLGVYVGSGIGGIHTFVSEAMKLHERGPSRVSPLFIPMMISNMAAGNIAIRFNAKGPSLPTVTACATSANTIGEGMRCIRHGYADIIIAGGTEATIIPLAVAGFSNCMALSESTDKNRASIPFDKERNGFVMGEGAAILILEEYNHAKMRGAKIYAELAGYGNTCDAGHITAPRPDAEGAAEAISLAIKEAGGLKEGEGIYINAHGTSTPLNDASETLAIKKALGSHAYKALVSSTKSMTGHMLGAAGATEAIAALLALKHSVVPPTIGYKVPDPECDLDYVPNARREAKIELALSNSLGFGGHNVCLAFRKV